MNKGINMIKVFIFFLSLCFSSPLFSHWDSAYFRNANDGFSDKKNWMAKYKMTFFYLKLRYPVHMIVRHIKESILIVLLRRS